MNRIPSPTIILFVALLAALIAIPLVVTNLYYLGVITFILINTLLVVSFWFILQTGQVNIGHAAFAAIGGYMSAALMKVYGFSSWLSLPVAVGTAGVVALIIGFITLRITGIYFIIVTIALGEIAQIVFGMWKHPFGGLVGLLYLPPPNPITIPGLFAIQFTSAQSLYFLTLFFVLLGVVVIYRLNRSSIGLVFRGIQYADTLAEHVGINIMGYKVLAFVIGCMCAGLAGVLYTYVTPSIQPTTFTLVQSTYYVVYAAVGGLAYFPGPIIGTVVLSIISEVIRPIRDFEPIIYASLLIMAMLLVKGGLFGFLQKLWSLFAGWIKRTNVKFIKKFV